MFVERHELNLTDVSKKFTIQGPDST
ncbi:protein of unknown function (plasmid) [Caballeronia sp. S22]